MDSVILQLITVSIMIMKVNCLNVNKCMSIMCVGIRQILLLTVFQERGWVPVVLWNTTCCYLDLSMLWYKINLGQNYLFCGTANVLSPQESWYPMETKTLPRHYGDEDGIPVPRGDVWLNLQLGSWRKSSSGGRDTIQDKRHLEHRRGIYILDTKGISRTFPGHLVFKIVKFNCVMTGTQPGEVHSYSHLSLSLSLR